MNANENGIALTKAELRALREFASKEPTDRERFGVKFIASGDRCFARATNSRICLELDGESDGTLEGEWFVDQKFLIDGRKLLEGKQVLRLKFSGASLHEACVEENGVERETLGAQQDAAIAQITFPPIEKTLKLPSARRDRAHCFALAEGYLHALRLAAAAVEEEFVELFPPESADVLMVFRAGTERKTSLKGGILPGVTEESTRDGDEDEDDEKPKRRRSKKDDRQTEIAGTGASSAE